MNRKQLMQDEENRVRTLRQQQAAIAEFGSLALRQNDLLAVFTEAARVCAQGLGVRFCKVCQYRPAQNDLLIIAGWGWQPGVVGHVVSSADKTSPQGFSFITGKPSICKDVSKEKNFRLPDFYAAHNIISTIDVVIKGDKQPYGVLEIDSDVQRDFDKPDIDFLTAFANVLGEAVATAARLSDLRRNVEQMKTTAIALTESEERFRIVLNAAPAALLMFGADGRVRMANAQAERAFGYSNGELVGEKIDLLVPERFRARYPAVVSELFSASPPGPGTPELFCLHKDGHEFQVEIGLNSIDLEGNPTTLSSIVDISERTKLEAQLRQSQKMEAVGRLTAGVAHDFNNLLQALTGGLEMLLDHVSDRPSAWEYGRIALRAARRGGDVTHRLLAFSRQQQLVSRAVPVRQLFEDVKDLVAGTFGPNIRLTVAPIFGDPTIMADAAQLQAAIINLAMNARDAMDGNGPLTLSTYAQDDPENSTLKSGGFIIIAVEDTGIGMDAATVAQACEPFFTTKGLAGSGLGLSMVQGFARQSGGDLRIVSAVGRGTRVEIWLPSVRPPEAAAHPVVRQESNGHILLVDDEADVLITIGAFLRSSGYLVTSVETGDKALARLLAGERFDAIVTDYAMPGLNGLNLLRQAREVDPTLPGLIISGYYELGTGGALDGAAILRKPFTRAQLIECVDGLVAERRRRSAKEPNVLG
jgi:PAS domain S-box-containing protein